MAQEGSCGVSGLAREMALAMAGSVAACLERPVNKRTHCNGIQVRTYLVVDRCYAYVLHKHGQSGFVKVLLGTL